ncbi:MAG TPA: hypothetical protein VFQ13_17480 [Anaerolineales bacterium]|nr:hypothetical protein [Anaerolineales bacterium]
MNIAALSLLVIGSLACNMVTTSSLATATVQPSTVTVAVQASPVPDDAQPSSTPVPDMAQPSASLDPCTLVTAAEAEAILGQPVGPASPMNGACAYSNASDALYMVSAAAAQDQETSGILQGQMMMLGFGSVQLDESGVNKLRSLAESMDYRGFFTELVTISQGAPTMTAQLVEGEGNDVAYWVWVSAQNRRQGGFVAARGQTLVNINLIVADSQTEEAMLAAATSLADQAFGRLPSKFTLAMPTTQAPPPTPTLVVPVKTIVGTWERRTAEITERLVFNADGSYSVEARNNSTNEIVAGNSGTFTYDGSTIHYVDKNKRETTETYNLGQDGDVLVLNNQTDRSWARIE